MTVYRLSVSVCEWRCIFYDMSACHFTAAQTIK